MAHYRMEFLLWFEIEKIFSIWCDTQPRNNLERQCIVEHSIIVNTTPTVVRDLIKQRVFDAMMFKTYC